MRCTSDDVTTLLNRAFANMSAGGTSANLTPVHGQTACSAAVFAGEGVKGRAGIGIDHERAEFGLTAVHANALESAVGDGGGGACLESE